MFHSISGWAVPEEYRFRSNRRVQKFFFLWSYVDLAWWEIHMLLLVAVMFPLQRLASDFFV